MNKLQLFRLLRHNTNLSYKRSPAFEQNQWAKVLMYLGAGLFCIYLILYGTIIGATADGEADTILRFMPIVLAIDFSLRFIVQTTPAMMVKPYILLPISRYTAIECFLVSSHCSGYNFLWLGMFLPYAVIVFFAGATIWQALYVVIAAELLIILNSQVYLFFRTLINRNVLWTIPAIILYALPFSPLLLNASDKAISKLFETYGQVAMSPFGFLFILLALTLLFFVNRHFQFKYVYEEISRKKDRELKTISSFAFLERFGIVGEYLKIELKFNLRNKAMKQRCIASLSLMVVFSMLVAYTPIYDGTMMTNFWCLYCFAIYSVTSLIKIMGQEGNYIDLLMTRRENILSLLKAKYLFYSVMLIIPYVIMIPAVFTGKYTLLMLTAYLLLVAGFIHFVIFQLAVYNKQTLPLQQKVTGRGNLENGMQIVIELLALFGPGVIVGIGYITVGLDATYVFMCVLGLALLLTHPLWLRNIYYRMMRRRYENIEGFRSTRV